MLLTNSYNGAEVALVEKQTFPHDKLIDLGFEFMGFCWGDRNKPYHELDTEIGTICVVNYKDVYLIKGNREHKMRKISNVEQLNQFINLLETL